MHGFDLIATIAGGFTAALVFGYITQRIGLSPLVGYLLAGVLIGPHTPGFVADAALAEQLAEIGVILLMFGVGLQFHFDELARRARRRRARRDRAKRGRDAAGRRRRARLRLVVAGRHRLRDRVVGGQHGGARPRACRQPRPAHAHRPHRRRLARRRGPVHGRRARAAAGAVRRASRVGSRPGAGARPDGTEGGRAGRLHGRRRDARSSRGCWIASPRRDRASCSR